MQIEGNIKEICQKTRKLRFDEILKLDTPQQIDYLKVHGFFEMKTLEQIEYLREICFHRVDINDRISFLDRIGMFDIDVNEDPPTKPLEPDDKDLDYLKERPINATKNRISNDWKRNFIIRNGQLIIEGTPGIEQALDIKSGAIITCNHFNPFDSFSIEQVLEDAGSEKRLFKVSREGNFTNFNGTIGADFRKIGLYFKYDNILPLSQRQETMKMFEEALKIILTKRKEFVLVCPEQSMWFGYRKPKPFKYGAFKWATENNVPVLPTFITQRQNFVGDMVQRYTIHFGEPIYPDKNLSPRENAKKMRDANFEFCRSVYEKVYGEPLEYGTIIHNNIPSYVSSTPGFENLMVRERGLNEDR